MAASTTTALEICNAALRYIGVGQAINSFEQATQASRDCKVFYEKTRDALLESFPWKFATKRADLALVDDEERSGWTYTYLVPADCITPRYIYPGERMPNALDKIPFDLESLSTDDVVSGQCLLTDEADAELIYTAQVISPSLFSPLFVEALAWALAVKLAMSLAVKPDWAKNAKVEAELAFRRAGAAQFRASQQDPNPPSEYTSAR